MAILSIRCLCVLFLLLAGLIPVAAGAQAVPVARECHAAASAAESLQQVVADARRWDCGEGGWALGAEAMLIRFDLADSPDRAPPRSMVTHGGHFERIDIGVIGRDGAARWESWTPATMRHLTAGPYMTAPLPQGIAQPRQVIVRVVRPWGKTTLSQMRLDARPEGTGWPVRRIVAMAAICGMLLVPLLINIAFYSVLPERYVIWHLAMVGAMLVQAGVTTGFSHLFFETRAIWEWQASNMAFVTLGAAALMFAACFIERGMIPPLLRRLAKWLAAGLVVTGLVASIPIEPLRAWSAYMIHAMVALTIAQIAAMVGVAWWRGSIAARYLIVGWTGIILVGCWRVAAYMLPSMRPIEMIEIYHLALALEVLVTALAIVSRFVGLREERDSATARALELEGVAARDPLTGLRNRRSIERRFDDLFRQGFRTMAVIDLDHFKAVNDTLGHATGDQVLRAVGAALVEDRDTKAIRLGGEEFMLLLRGKDAASRAERRRRAISARITSEVPGLDRVVTASMGLVEHDPGGSLKTDFAMLYSHCDRLLYEAKRLGRNRTMKERLTSFEAASRTAVA